MIKIVPAILAKSYEEFESMVRKIEPYTDLVQLDIADGIFVSNKTINGYSEIKKIQTKLNFEVHLMVNNPEAVIGNWLNTKVVRYLVHLEAVTDFEFLINRFNTAGCQAGCVFNPETDYSAVEPHIDRFDLFQFMTVDPGFYGSRFLPEVLEKIRNFHTRYSNKTIQVDGGINPETIKLIRDVGATSAAVGSYIFKSNNIDEALKRLTMANV